MASLIVVVLKPWGKCCAACVVGVEDLPTGPLGLQGAVEALHLAVLPRAVWRVKTCRASSWSTAARMALLLREAKALSVITRWIRVIPAAWKYVAARVRKFA